MMRVPQFAALMVCAAAVWLSGCGIGSSNGVGSAAAPIVAAAAPAISGRVHGGQQPVSGATIQLYAVGTSGLGSASTPLIGSSVLTGSDGSFNITGKWSCTNTAVYGADPLLYLVASGGNPGLGAGGNNPALVMLTALGRCSTLSSSTFIAVNELTAIASIYALSPFMVDAAHIGASAATKSGLQSAFDTVNALVNTASGTAPGPLATAGETVPVAELNTLADAIAACVNSNGGGVCASFFAAVTPAGGTAPTDTASALLRIARAPAFNAATIFNMTGSISPFQPTLASAPADWSVGLRITGGVLSGPSGVAIDAAGNVWVANAGGGAVTALTSQCVPIAGANGYTGGGTIFGAQALAIDKQGSVWLADTLLSTVVKLTLSGTTVQQSASYSSGGSGPAGIAVDGQNHVWVANFANGSVSELNTNGTLVGAPLTAGGTLQAPAGVALDAAGNAWVTDNATGLVTKFDKNQALLSGAGFNDGALVAPEGIAIDATGRAWVAGNGDNGISLLHADGSADAASPYLTVSMPTSVALDGAGVAWVTSANGIASVQGGVLTGLGSLNAPVGLAIDASGNVWTANSGDDSLTKFVGLATPVVTPMAANVGP